MTQHVDVDAIQKRAEAADQEVGRMCEGGRWTMRVPAEPERDSDLVIGSALKDNADLIAEVRRLREAGDALAEAVEGLKNISARAGGQAFATEAWERWQELRGTEAMEAGTR